LYKKGVYCEKNEDLQKTSDSTVNNFHSVGSGVRERFQDNFGALISKLLPDSPDVVKFLRYLIFLIYAIVVF